MRAPAPRRPGLVDYFVRHPTAGNLLMLAMLLAGLWGGLSMRTQYFPDVPVESVVVNIPWPGASPEAVDAQIAARVEPVLRAIDGVSGTRVNSTRGWAWILVDFEPHSDMSRATEEVRARIDGIAGLPPDIDPPQIRRRAFRDRVTDVVIHGNASPDLLALIANELRTRLFAEGVTRMTLEGNPSPVYDIEISEAAMLRHGLDLAAIAEVVRATSQIAPAGSLGETGQRVSAGQDRRTLGALGDVVLRHDAQGEPLPLRAVAEVTTRTNPNAVRLSVGGRPAVILSVDRGEADSAIAVQAQVEAAVAEIRPTLPAGVEVSLTRTRSEAINQRLTLLLHNAIAGVLIVLVLLFLFLSARTALWIAAGIPAAMGATFGAMALAGMTIDMMSLFALILCLGIVVDDAIVVGEHADTLGRRLPPAVAAEQAAREMFAPVLAASVTTIVAFCGLIVVGGRFGTMILPIPLIVSFVLLASLAECFLVLPAHMRHALAHRSERRWIDAPSRLVDRGFSWFRDRLFRPALRLMLRLRLPVLAGSVALLLWSVSLIVDGTVKWRFFDAPESGVITVNFSMADGSDPADAVAMLAELERATAAVNEQFRLDHGVKPVSFALGRLGGNFGWSGDASNDGRPRALLGGLQIELIDPDLRPFTQNEVLRKLDAAVVAHPQLDSLSLRGQQAGPELESVSVELRGADPRTLKQAAEALKLALGQLDGVTGLEDSQHYVADELRIVPTPEGESLGLQAADIARLVRDRLQGVEAFTFPLGEVTAKVVVRVPQRALTPDYLEAAWVRLPGGRWARLGEVASVTQVPGFGRITRVNGAPVVTVNGQIATDDPAAASAIVSAMESRIVPEIARQFDIDWTVSGLREEERNFLSDAALGFALCVAGIYLTLAWIFGSWTRPLVVVLVIPFGLVGAVWGHVWLGVSLSMFSVVGLIGMSGVIVNDAIVLITSMTEKARDRALIPALVEATCDRLRPVFLTTATTLGGFGPLLLERSTQAQFLKPTVITLFFGLGAGMLLVLVVVPTMVAVAHDASRSLAGARRLVRARLARRRGLGRGWQPRPVSVTSSAS